MRVAPTLLVLGLLAGGPASAQLGLQKFEPGAPWYVPRAAFAGLYVKDGLVTPQARIQWQLTLGQMFNDALVLVVEGGGGWAISRPAGVISFYQHLVGVGVAYRATYRNGFHWGFHAITGPVFFGGQFEGLPDERRIDGTVDGRVHFGFDLGPLTVGVGGGFAQNYTTPRWNSTAQSPGWAGGAIFGVFLDWRPLPVR